MSRSLISSAARPRISRRSRHGVAAQAGWAAGGGDGPSTSATGALRECPEHDVAIDRRADLEAAVAVTPLAVDQLR